MITRKHSRFVVRRPPKSRLCRLGFHRYDTVWANITPRSGGGPRLVRERCLRCFYEHVSENAR